MARTKQKSWSYAQITANAREQIADFMQKSKSAETSYESNMYKSWGRGAYNLWYSLTCGWDHVNDQAEMKALLE
jgi:hypothetical protein